MLPNCSENILECFVTVCVAMRASERQAGARQKSVKVLLILIKDEKGAGSSQSHPLSLWELGGGGKRRRHALSGCGELE